ncbi:MULTISPECIES: hypothetical protein [unclassified Enterococcus]|uniref:hypothetical protein n=1 Tax=unclassified Enterococcus TaxID=2608891 RepID=UPI000A343AE8|nr:MULTISPECIES: hypothetical protein [unclassified Enterococcus]OTO77417.1 hypothetical protein A5865_001293 [Enterococcus sp. 12E11_DIV0728]OUZ16405.1 hypothetical protein A5868_001326 [Enterococcus sp. 12F9_DIV0723]
MALLFLFILWLAVCCIYVRKDSEKLIVLVLYSFLSFGLIVLCTYSLIVERDTSYLAVIAMSVIVLFQDGLKTIVGVKECYHSFKKGID